MPNDLSNEFHGDIDALKALAAKELQNIENGAATLLADLKAVAVAELPTVEAYIQAAAVAGVEAALAAASGGTFSSIFAAGVAGATALLTADGKELLDDVMAKLETMVGVKSLAVTAPPAAG